MYAEFHSQLSFITKSLFSFTIKSKRNLYIKGFKIPNSQYKSYSMHYSQNTFLQVNILQKAILESSFHQLNNYTQNINSDHYHEFSISSPATVSFWIQRERAMFSSLMRLLAKILTKTRQRSHARYHSVTGA